MTLSSRMIESHVSPSGPKWVLDMVIPGVSEKKYGVADYQYFENGKTQQCDIFRLITYNLCLVGCEVLTPYVRRK